MRAITHHSSSRIRGGSFFTMLIFIMLLLSSALMYYYFQRTRMLEHEVVALRKGEVPEADGLSSWIPWTKPAPSELEPTSGSADSVAEGSPAAAPIESTSLPPTINAPTNVIPSSAEALDSITTNAIQSDSSLATDVNTPEITEPDQPESAEKTPAGPPKKIDSVYDTEPPPVRVRSPRRDTR